MQDMKWLGAGADVAVRAAFSLGMCGALAGFLYLTAQNGIAESSVTPAEPAAATLVATLDTKPALSQAVVDASPPAVAVPVKVSTPFIAAIKAQTVIPTKRPDVPAKASAVARNSPERFDTCLPNCETHDPMIVGYAEKDPAPFQSDPQVDAVVEEPVSLPVLQSAGSLLGRALEVPADAMRKGRSAIASVVRATL